MARTPRHFVAAAVLAAVAVSAPAHAFSVTVNSDGSFEYFFAAPSLRIESDSSLDFSGLRFIDGVDGGFRVAALFGLHWLGGENASAALSGSRWSGFDSPSRSLAIVAGGNLSLDSARLSLPGGTLSLAGSGEIRLAGNATVDAGGVSIDAGRPRGIIVPAEPMPVRAPSVTIGGGSVLVEHGGSISVAPVKSALPWIMPPIEPAPRWIMPPVLAFPSPVIQPIGGYLELAPGGAIEIVAVSPVPEPGSAALFLAGMAALVGVSGRRRRARR